MSLFDVNAIRQADGFFICVSVYIIISIKIFIFKALKCFLCLNALEFLTLLKKYAIINVEYKAFYTL